MNAASNDISLIALLAMGALLPFLVAIGTCYIKFTVVFTLVRNALGLQQVPSDLVINGISLILAFFVMQPIILGLQESYSALDAAPTSLAELMHFLDESLGDYKAYLARYSDPELLRFFQHAQHPGEPVIAQMDAADRGLLELLPSYALSELKDAFLMGFYLYLPFVVVDLVVSSILLSLGMMMMSPVTVSAPIKLVLFVMLDGWAMLSKGLVTQYLDVAS